MIWSRHAFLWAGVGVLQAVATYWAAGFSAARHAGAGGFRLHLRLHQVTDESASR